MSLPAIPGDEVTGFVGRGGMGRVYRGVESSADADPALRFKTEFPDVRSDKLAERLSRKPGSTIRPENCSQILKRSRGRFAAHLIDEVRAGLDSEAEERLQEELAALGLLEFIRDHLPVTSDASPGESEQTQ